MKGLPDPLPVDGQEAFTGLVCPDCSGNLVVERDAGYVSFRCRVGHTYSVVELLAAKESRLEDRMWSVVFGFEEMAALLESLDGHGLTGPVGRDAGRERAARAREQGARLRAMMQNDRPLLVSSHAVGRAAGPSSP